MPIINLKDVSRLYGFGDATTVALEDINLEINKGEFVAIMGPSGSGKSTLMNVIGLLDRPTYGAFTLHGDNVEALKDDQRAKVRRDKIGFVFQSFSLLPNMNVLENVALPLAYQGANLHHRILQARTMLERVGLGDRSYFLPTQLSGGQVQRVAIARSLINQPEIIIADEPTGNLDSIASRLVMELLADIHKMGNTILMVTHNPELTRYATRVLFMRDGMIVHDEKKSLGDISESSENTKFFEETTNEEHDIAGVSAMLTVETDQGKYVKMNPQSTKKSRKPSVKRPTKKKKYKRSKKS
ncbi:hypothetical protein A3F37_02690 [Candidatus Saccharibacteria bacterium RIFCSPHIGHO2_12_FULL_41_12]|nr:MAG: hypothetical protein A3F37_02690 [Candidatus Saccharibacteria bacterium RIFCSPHIGHO2_12_FULL_41_12]